MRPSFLEEMSWAMGEVYAEVVDRILINLAHYFPYIKDGKEPKGSFEYQARMLAQMGQVNRETAAIIRDGLKGADAALRDGLEAAILESLRSEEPKLRKAAEKGLLHGAGFLPPEVDPGQMQAFKSYYRQSADKLNLVNTVMLESTEQAYQATVSDIVNRVNGTQRILNASTGEVVTGASTWNQAVRHAVDRMVENGLTGFVDHAGHRWRPETYAAMDIKTTMFNTARAAVWERNEQYGNDLYQVSSHNGARPLCYPWQGKVISRADRSGTVEDLDGNQVEIWPQSQTSYGQAAGLFGVNCKHYPMAFIPGFSTLRGQPQDPEENEKTYAESQEQRRLERNLREKRLKVEQLKAQGAPEEEIKAAKAKAREASSRVQEFCDETGRTRRRNREGTPVIASWKGSEKGPFESNSSLKNEGYRDIMKRVDPPIRSLSNEDARKWYLERDAEIPSLIDRTQSIEDQARQACALRNRNRTMTRELMADQETRKKLDEDSPNMTFEEHIADKMARKHLTREEAIVDILKTATKTNQAVNDQFGLKGEGST